MKKRKKKKRTPTQILKDKTWKEFSKYIRTKGADKDGFNECFTCGVKKHYTKLNAGHFKHGKLDFDEMNVNPQCVGCNMYGRGKLDVYAIKLLKLYGAKKLKDLDARAEQTLYLWEDLTEIYEKFKKINSKNKLFDQLI